MKGISHVLKVSDDNREKPTLSLTAKDLPEIKDWKVGSKYKLEIDVEQTGLSKDEYGERGMCARFKVLKVTVDDGKDEDDEDEE